MQKQIDSLQTTIDPGPPGRSAPGPQTDVRFEGQSGRPVATQVRRPIAKDLGGLRGSRLRNATVFLGEALTAQARGAVALGNIGND
jgi:hypothetical protein